MKMKTKLMMLLGGVLLAAQAVFAGAGMPDECTVETKFTFGCVYGASMWSDYGYSEREIWDGFNSVVLDGTRYAFFPVSGDGVIMPVILHDDTPAEYLDAAEVWTDQKMFDTFTPKGVSQSKWEDEDDSWEYESGKKWWGWTKSIWPNNKVIAGRRWIVVHAKHIPSVWSGVTSFRVGIAGTSATSDPVLVLPPSAIPSSKIDFHLNPADFMRGISFQDIDGFTPWGWFDSAQFYHDYWERIWMQAYEIDQYTSEYDDGIVKFSVSVPSAGTLVVAGETSHDYDGDEDPASQYLYSVSGKGIVSDRVAVNTEDYLHRYYDLESGTNFWKATLAVNIRRIEVSGATTLTFTSRQEADSVCGFARMHFFPKSGRSVAIDAAYVAGEDMDGFSGNDYWWSCYVQGCVKGTGVYKSGETAALEAVTGPGQEFDRWIVRYGNLILTEAQATSPTLSFKVTDAMCGAMEDEEQIFISALWKPKYKVTALPSIVGAGTVTGSGRYFKGETVTLSATAAPGCEFVQWSDGVTDATRTLKVAAAQAEHVIYACFAAPNGVPNLEGWKVTLNANGGTLDGAALLYVNKGKAVGSLPTPTKDGYAFVGWFTAATGGTQVTATTKVTNDVTYYAHWQYRGAADDSTIVFETQDEYTTAGDGSFTLDFSKVVGSTSVPKVTVKGLPAGLKFDAKTLAISGIATKPGVYTVTVSATNATVKKAVETTFTITVPNLSCDALPGLKPATDAYGVFEVGTVFAPEGVDCAPEGDGWKVAVGGLPAGLKFDAKTGLISGVPTKAGTYTVTFTATKGKEKQIATITLNVAALPDGATGTFCGFVKDGDENAAAFQLTATELGKLTAKVTTAEGAVSFAGAGWTSAGNGVYEATLETKKGERLTLSLDSAGAWNAYQLTGAFTSAGGAAKDVVAQRNAFANKTWLFSAAEANGGWDLAYALDAKAANLTVTLKADGSTSVAGKFGATAVSATGYADVSGLSDGVIYADFAPVVSEKEGTKTVKRVLSFRLNLWFDRAAHGGEVVGTARRTE